jgi:hypothetical protein
VREAWGIGKKSITNVVHLLEKHGVKVFWLSEETASIDAFSFWKDDVLTFSSTHVSQVNAAVSMRHMSWLIWYFTVMVMSRGRMLSVKRMLLRQHF